jgi:hypothetical protein
VQPAPPVRGIHARSPETVVLKAKRPRADQELMALDTTLLAHWQSQQSARARARRRLPPGWLDDPRPRMGEVADIYVEFFAQTEQAAAPAVQRKHDS